ncbi:MAG: hypothetical protein LC785_02075 [Acidobacteria bacterium]|nr:hypothetical protein [Acidobacteriota bacterium]MCA1640774.1 hypothetical protein [Acidobacteriota bacterium]
MFDADDLTGEPVGAVSANYRHKTRRFNLNFAARRTLRLTEPQTTLRCVKELLEKGHASPMDMAIVYAGLGEKDEALAWLQKGCEERSGPWVFLKVEPLYETLRSDPRFRELLQRVGLAS